MKKNISKTPGMKSDKAKIEIMPVYVPAQTSDGTPTDVVYHDADGNVIETRDVAKPIVVSYLDEVEGTGASDVFVAISRDDGDTWKRRNISKTADKSSLHRLPGRVPEAHAQGQGQHDLRGLDRQVLPRRAAGLRHHGLPGHAGTDCRSLRDLPRHRRGHRLHRRLPGRRRLLAGRPLRCGRPPALGDLRGLPGRWARCPTAASGRPGA